MRPSYMTSLALCLSATAMCCHVQTTRPDRLLTNSRSSESCAGCLNRSYSMVQWICCDIALLAALCTNGPCISNIRKQFADSLGPLCSYSCEMTHMNCWAANNQSQLQSMAIAVTVCAVAVWLSQRTSWTSCQGYMFHPVLVIRDDGRRCNTGTALWIHASLQGAEARNVCLLLSQHERSLACCDVAVKMRNTAWPALLAVGV